MTPDSTSGVLAPLRGAGRGHPTSLFFASLDLDMDSPFTEHAKCRDVDPDALFVVGKAQNHAKLLCRSCPVQADCLAEALDNRIEFGVWGGMTERERRALLRRRTDVPNWRELLERARSTYEQAHPPQTRRPFPATTV
ncbi:WhiB family transcriptional regulator [Nocardiopsis sp. ATB16-24]|uniref:WhiB family transcriptional regulator n=1 Tax=Nocardiopsis sp. ATB16-24 TaxID=3019555 RepID=UPI0025537424|nr:WhiB family transcriptional regulator [Nocardiopsis sp. ATB16-24]